MTSLKASLDDALNQRPFTAVAICCTTVVDLQFDSWVSMRLRLLLGVVLVMMMAMTCVLREQDFPRFLG
jgi:hypothetical protein